MLSLARVLSLARALSLAISFINGQRLVEGVDWIVSDIHCNDLFFILFFSGTWLVEGVDWIVSDIASRIYMLD